MKKLTSILVLACLFCEGAFAGDNQYFVRHGQNSDNMGPYSESELKTRLKDGLVKPTDYIWSAPMKKWTQVSSSPIFGGNEARVPASDQSPPPFPGDENKVESGQTTENKLSGYVRPLIGLSIPVSGAPGGAYFTPAGEIGFQKKVSDIGWNIGIFGATSGSSSVTNGVTVSGNITALMLSLTAQNGIFYYGGRFGIGIVNASASNSTTSLSSSGSSIVFAPVVGVSLPVTEHISIDIETSWITMLSLNLSGTLGTIPYPSVGYLVPLAGATIRF